MEVFEYGGKILMDELVCRLREFMENEARSCSMDIGGITPEYVYRMWGGTVPINEIEAAFEVLKRNDDLVCIGVKKEALCMKLFCLNLEVIRKKRIFATKMHK